jgi:dTDP-glucose 4,6-dehydratase
LIEFVKDRLGHDLRYSINADKVSALGWKPRIKFEEGIKKTLQWYKRNVEWWKPIIEKEQINFHNSQ